MSKENASYYIGLLFIYEKLSPLLSCIIVLITVKFVKVTWDSCNKINTRKI